MADQEPFTTPEGLMQLVATISRVCERNPGDVAAIHDAMVEHLKRGPQISHGDPFEHVAHHVREIFPAIMRDTRLQSGEARLLEEFDEVGATGDVSPVAGIVAVAALAIALVSAGAVWYCLGGPDPPPGESIEARC